MAETESIDAKKWHSKECVGISVHRPGLTPDVPLAQGVVLVHAFNLGRDGIDDEEVDELWNIAHKVGQGLVGADLFGLREK